MDIDHQAAAFTTRFDDLTARAPSYGHATSAAATIDGVRKNRMGVAPSIQLGLRALDTLELSPFLFIVHQLVPPRVPPSRPRGDSSRVGAVAGDEVDAC